MPREGMGVPAGAVSFNTAHDWRLCKGEGFVPSHRAAARRAWQRAHGQVVPFSGQWSRWVRARAELYSSSAAAISGSYESSEAGPGRELSAGGGEVGGETGVSRACGWGGWEA
eukprot:2449480-Pleurochrysis_carterae.AAC.1